MIFSLLAGIAGGSSGLVMGLFGGGSGLVLVPAISILFQMHPAVPNEDIMRYAVGTTFAITVIFVIFTIYLQHRRRAIIWSLFKDLALGIILGTFLGNLSLAWIPNRLLEVVFGIASITLALWFYRYTPPEAHETKLPNKKLLFLAATFFGIVCGILAIAPFTVPYLRRYGVDMKNAIATSTTCGFLMAIVGTVTALCAGWNIPNAPAHTIGFIYLPFVIPMSIGCMIFSHIGVELAHRLSPKTLKTIYSILLIIVGLKMLLH